MNVGIFQWLKRLNAIATLAVVILFVQAGSAKAATYYVSSHAGDDSHDGRSAETAWKSLEKANSITFKPGDSLLLESDSVFRGQLSPKGSGTMKDGKVVPIVIDRFGDGALPRINGEGRVNAPLFLHNVEGWEVQNIELTNKGKEREISRYGVYVLIDAIPVARHFVIRNVSVIDVNGALPKGHDDTAACAIRMNAENNDIEGQDLPGRRFDGVLIEDCHVKDCARNGIVISGAASREQWNPSTGVVIRRNLLAGVCGDGILVIGCDGPLVEWNIMRDCPDFGEEVGAAAGMWPWSCDNAVFQFNEVVGHKAWNDAQAYDCDYNCNNTLYQYNLSQDNHGGFMLICSPGKNKPYDVWNRGSVVRYNLSMSDGLRSLGRKQYFSPIFSITGETTQDTEIYSNLIIVPKKPDLQMDTDLIAFDKWGGKYPVNTEIRGNVFVMLDGQPGTFDIGRAKQVRFDNNRFYGNVAKIVETAEVKSSGDTFISDIPREVTISGSKEELQTFADFLEKKGNPNEAQGIFIRWDIIR